MAELLDRIEGRQRSCPEVVIKETTVEKRQAREQTRFELARTQLGHQIGKDTGLFEVPKIIACDLEAGVITLERLRNIVPLREALAEQADPPLLERVGRALAAIHAHLRLPEELVVPLPDLGPRLRTPPVFLHGDFSTGNVQYDRARDRLVILDWSTAYPLDFRLESQGGVVWLDLATLGPGYFDVGFLMLSLLFRRPGAAMRVRDPEQHVRTFVLSYFASAQYPWSAEEFVCYFYHFRLLYLKLKRWLMGQPRFFIYRASLWNLDRFVRSMRRDLEAMAAGQDGGSSSAKLSRIPSAQGTGLPRDLRD